MRQPFWVDTIGRSGLMEIRVDLGDRVLRLVTRRALAYEANAHIFVLWMLGAMMLLLTVAIIFLRNQIRPILRLARAAEDFGKGRDADFTPHGAREVRQAGHAFIEMKRRIERATEQRTAMLNGVSHDLRTILTRFKLSLALLDNSADSELLQKDVDEMGSMLEGYLAFARGDASEPTVRTDVGALLEDLRADAERHGAEVSLDDSRGSRHPRAADRAQSAASATWSPTPSVTPTMSRSRRSGRPSSSRSSSTTTASAFPPSTGRMFSGHSIGSTKPETRTRAAPASDSPSPATSPARMAATSS